jgi:CheY-like chemotaxis protein
MGMTKEVQARAFDPFYTTKEKGKGTGLGLSTCYGIVTNNGGQLWLYSEVGVGTTFRIYLPRVLDALSPREPEDQTIDVGLGETVLVVEDEDSVRALAAEVLGMAGYHVLQAPDGKAAMKLVANYKDPIHIMVTDVVMPGMTGRELSEVFEEVRPEIKVLFVSGFTDDEILREGAMTRTFSFLQKPFSPVQLARKVREVLDLTREAQVAP